MTPQYQYVSFSAALACFYNAIGSGIGLELDLERIERDRPRMAQLLREKSKKPNQEDEAKTTDQ